jgi:hypothetical protein
MADSLPLNESGMVSLYVIHQQSGARYTRDAFNAQWMRGKKGYCRKNLLSSEFNFTLNLKAKISDFRGNSSRSRKFQVIKTHLKRRNITEKFRAGGQWA